MNGILIIVISTVFLAKNVSNDFWFDETYALFTLYPIPQPIVGINVIVELNNGNFGLLKLF